MTMETRINPDSTPRLEWALANEKRLTGRTARSNQYTVGKTRTSSTIDGSNTVQSMIAGERQKLETPGSYSYTHGYNVVVTKDSPLVRARLAREKKERRQA